MWRSYHYHDAVLAWWRAIVCGAYTLTRMRALRELEESGFYENIALFFSNCNF